MKSRLIWVKTPHFFGLTSQWKPVKCLKKDPFSHEIQNDDTYSACQRWYVPSLSTMIHTQPVNDDTYPACQRWSVPSLSTTIHSQPVNNDTYPACQRRYVPSLSTTIHTQPVKLWHYLVGSIMRWRVCHVRHASSLRHKWRSLWTTDSANFL